MWTSARRANATALVQKILSAKLRIELAGVWAREDLGLTPAQFDAKVQVYKDLERVWADQTVQSTHPAAKAGGRWNACNTILLDDSAEKAAYQPYNLLQIPQFTGNIQYEKRNEPLRQAWNYIYKTSYFAPVHAKMREEPFQILLR